jgi:hypothetical protein
VAVGIHNSGSGSTLDAEGVTALAKENTYANTALEAQDSGTTKLRGGSFTVDGTGGTHPNGLSTGNDTTLEAEGVTSFAYGGANTYGVGLGEDAVVIVHGSSLIGRGASSNNFGAICWASSSHSGVMTINHSVLEGAQNSVSNNAGTVNVNHSRLVGGAAGGSVTCVAVSRGGTFNASGCP